MQAGHLSTLTVIYAVTDTAAITVAVANNQDATSTIEDWECPASLWTRPGLQWNIHISTGGLVVREELMVRQKWQHFIIYFWGCPPSWTGEQKFSLYNENTNICVHVK